MDQEDSLKKRCQVILIAVSAFLASISYSAELSSWKSHYTWGEDVWIALADQPHNVQDWVGIYPKGSSTDWHNVVQWAWAKDTSPTQEDPGDWYRFSDLPRGDYEAKFFLNNTYVAENTVAFSVGNTVELTSWTDRYSVGDDVWISLKNKPNNQQDWVGIYPEGSSTDWDHVIQWRWANDTSPTQEDPGDWYRFSDLPAGRYEARFFLNNSFVIEDKYAFRVDDVEADNFGDYGAYDVAVYTAHPDYTVYYSPGNTDGAKVVVLLPGAGSSVDNYRGLATFIASHGYFVLGPNSDRHYEAALLDALNTARHHHNVDLSHIGVIGHSLGAGYAFHLLQTLKAEEMAETSFVASLDGWFALDMSDAELKSLDTTTLIMQFGHADGIQLQNGGYFQDPRINQTLYQKLGDDEKALFLIEAGNSHGYIYGDDVSQKRDIRRPLHALLDYTFGEGTQQAKAIALDDRYHEVILYDPAQYRWKCRQTFEGVTYDYCTPE